MTYEVATQRLTPVYLLGATNGNKVHGFGHVLCTAFCCPGAQRWHLNSIPGGCARVLLRPSNLFEKQRCDSTLSHDKHAVCTLQHLSIDGVWHHHHTSITLPSHLQHTLINHSRHSHVPVDRRRRDGSWNVNSLYRHQSPVSSWIRDWTRPVSRIIVLTRPNIVTFKYKCVFRATIFLELSQTRIQPVRRNVN